MQEIVTNISTASANKIIVRGLDLANELIGAKSFTETLYFLLTQRMPTEAQTTILDACLVTLMEHGFTPSAIVARVTADSSPADIQVAVAAGLLTVGQVYAGTMEECAAILQSAASSADSQRYLRELADRYSSDKRPVPGFGHPLHKPQDPRTLALLQVATRVGLEGRYLTLLATLSAEVDRAFDKHITLNATGAIGALLLEIDIPQPVMRGIAVVSRAGGLLGHIQEERQTRSAREISRLVKRGIPYSDDPRK